MDITDFFGRGWILFPHDQALAAWLEAARGPAAAVVYDPANAKWWRHGGTWFVGVHALPNDQHGAINEGPHLAGSAVSFIAGVLGHHAVAWDRAQLSLCKPGYPQASPDESAAAHRYRVERDAAHVDGLLAEGPAKRRFAREHHAFILGIPLSEVTPETSPFVVREGSYHVMREAFATALGGWAPEAWHAIDITAAYHAARREVFATCRRIEISAKPGQCYLVHRLALHGMAAWRGTDMHQEGRAVAYFRPPLLDARAWLAAP